MTLEEATEAVRAVWTLPEPEFTAEILRRKQAAVARGVKPNIEAIFGVSPIQFWKALLSIPPGPGEPTAWLEDVEEIPIPTRHMSRWRAKHNRPQGRRLA